MTVALENLGLLTRDCDVDLGSNYEPLEPYGKGSVVRFLGS